MEKFEENEVLDFFMMAKSKCRKCGIERNEVCECNLPTRMRNELKEVGLSGRYLYCPKCKEYSVMTNF
jgi:hypothetical protein